MNGNSITISLLLLLLAVFPNCTPDSTQADKDLAVYPLFTQMPAGQTGIDFNNLLPEQSPGGMNIIQYLYYYNGGGVAAGDVNNDGLTDLYFTSNLGSNKLYLNKGNWQFEDVSARAGVGGTGSWKTGVSMVDINADGLLDIYVCQVGKYKSFNGRNQLFVNNGDGTFSEKAAEYGLDLQAFCTQATFFDYDLDGDLDCFVVCHSVKSSAAFRDTSLTRSYDPMAADRLYRNDQKQGKTFFTDVSAQAGIYGGTAGYGLSVATGDLNGDGYPDLYVANDFHENDYLYYNIGGKRFSEQITASMGHEANFSMGCDIADFNNDGLPDLLSLDMKPEPEPLLKASQPSDPYDVYLYKHSLGYYWQFPRNALQLNRGVPATGNPMRSARFSEIAELSGVATTDWSWSALFADLDQDGWKDLYITNGILRRPNDMDYLKFISSDQVQQSTTDLELIQKMPQGATENYVFHNRGDLQFDNYSRAWGLAQSACSNGAVYADLDNDGDLDLVTNNLNNPAFVYRNDRQNASWLRLQLHQDNNTFGVGASVKIWAAGKEQYYENQPVRGFQSCVEPVLTIGLGTAQTVDSMLVSWPGGAQQMLRQLPVNQVLQLDAKNAQTGQDKKTVVKTVFVKSDFPYTHRENNFQDNTREKLIPWFLSTQGPHAAVADVNADGLDDCCIGKILFLQQRNGQFTAAPLPYCAGEITANTFFDADSDGDPDLYLGTGGYESSQHDTAQIDYLLLNDGKGHFSIAGPDRLPAMYEQTSCAAACDFDGDGDQDLFVGSRAIAGMYGMTPQSFLLENDGKGHFHDVALARGRELTRAGMVTAAAWADMDKDGHFDLVLGGEWMNLTVFYQRNDLFEKFEIPNSSGLWQSLALADLDQDGDLDLVAGNLGLNSNLRASVPEPLGLWVKDFDRNGAYDPMLSYYRQGKNYVFADKDLLLSQLAFLKKRFVEYHKYAESTFEEVFDKDMRSDALHWQAVDLNSGWFENKGAAVWANHPLPFAAQMSPGMALLTDDFNGDGKQDILLAGNFYEVQPAIGRFDAGFGLLLQQNEGAVFNPLEPAVSGLWLDGAVRDLHWLRGASGSKRLLLIRNNGPASIFTK